MKIEFTEHAREKLEERKIREETVIEVLKNPDYFLFDTETQNFIAVAKEGEGWLIVAFAVERIVRVVTVLWSSKEDLIKKRIERGRWVKV